MGEKITLAELGKRLHLSRGGARNLLVKGRLVGGRTGSTPNAPVELDFEQSVLRMVQDSTKYTLDGKKLIISATGEIVWTFPTALKAEAEQPQAGQYLTRRKPLNVPAVENAYLQEFEKLGLNVFDVNGNPKNIITLAREQEALFKAKRAQLDFEVKLQTKVDMDMVQRLFADLAVNTCKAVLAIPDRVSPVISTMEDDAEIHRYLTEELNYALNNLSLEMEEMFKDKGDSEVDINDSDNT